MKPDTVPKQKVPLGISVCEDRVHLCDHIAYFWETEKQFNVAIGFLEVGLRGDDHCVIFGYEDANNKVLQILHSRGFDEKRLQLEKHLTVLTANATAEQTLNKIGKTFEEAIKNGAPMVRLLGNIGWNRPKWPNEVDLLAFEAKVSAACKLFPCVVVCMYDVHAISGSILLRGGMETHPITIRGNVTRVNPYYVDVETFLDRLKQEG